MNTLLDTYADLDRLADDLDGALVRPTDPDWDAARQAWHLTADQQPVAVVLAAGADDVATAVRAARDLGLRVAMQSTGHNALPLGSLADSLLVKTTNMRRAHLDIPGRRARVEAGAQWMDVTPLAGAAGLTALAGSAPDVGIAGYTLGGGLSWLARSHGLAANSVLALDVVTADGQQRRIDADNDPDLFWALRGGGGSFAAVTALEFALYPLTEVQAGVLFFPLDRAREVLHAWHEWTATVPDEVTSCGRLLRFPPLPDLPEHLRDQSFVVVEAICQLPAIEAAALLSPLRALGPTLDTFGRTPTAELGALHMDPDTPVPAFGDGMQLGSLTAAAIDAFVDAAGPDSPSALLSAELRQLGGALAPGHVSRYVTAGSPGAVSSLDADFALFGVGVTPDPAAAAAVRQSVEALHTAMAQWDAGTRYLNFSERPTSGKELFGADTYRRLREIKTAYDAADLFHSNHPVRPAR